MYKNRTAPFINSANNSVDFTQNSFNRALDLVREEIQDKTTAELLCDYLISIAPTQEEKDIMISIRDDEITHRKLLKEIYRYYTCEEIQNTNNENFIILSSYIEGINKAIFDKLNYMDNYKFIGSHLSNTADMDTMFRILTDEMKNLTKYNYILNNNSNSIYTNLSTDYYKRLKLLEEQAKEDFSTLSNYSRQKEFTLSELAQYDGTMGKPAYVAVNGIVYDVSNVPKWSKATHYGLTAGKDLSSQFESCHGVESKLAKLPKVGVLKV